MEVVIEPTVLSTPQSNSNHLLLSTMTQTSISTSDSDPSLQTCVKCGEEKPVDHFISRTPTKRPTKWCLACRHYGNERHKRWEARQLKRKREQECESKEETSSGETMTRHEAPKARTMSHRVRPGADRVSYTVPVFATKTSSHHSSDTSYFSITERTQVLPAGQAAAYQSYPVIGYFQYGEGKHPKPELLMWDLVPGPLGLQGGPGCLQIVAPPLNPSIMHSMMWKRGHGAPISMQSPRSVACNDVSPQPPVQETNWGSTSGSESEGSERTIFNSGSSKEGISNQSPLSNGDFEKGFSPNATPQDEISVHGTVKVEDSEEEFKNEDALREDFAQVSPVSSSPDVLGIRIGQFATKRLPGQSYEWEEAKEKVGEACQEERFRVSSEDPESSPAAYFVCFSCCTPRPTRLGDGGICVYCYEYPTQYCIQGGHEDEKTSFMDTKGGLHKVCNRCRTRSDLP